MKKTVMIVLAVILLSLNVSAGRTEIYAGIVGDTDSRQIVDDSAAEPYCMTVYVYSSFSDGEYKIGSGILVGPNIALTCCHCVMKPGELADSITVIPGKNGESEPFGRVNVTRIVRHSNLELDKEVNQDWAVLTLDSDIGYQTGWFSLIPPMEQQQGNYEGLHVWNIGYPEPGNTQFPSHGDDRLMLEGEGEILEEWGDNVVSGDWDSTNGNSGGPVFAMSGNGEIMLVGLASATTGTDWEDYPESQSICTLIGDDVYGIVQELLQNSDQDDQDSQESSWDSGSYYYAEGYGLSALLYKNTGSNLVCEIMNYNSTQDPYVGSAMNMYFLEWADDDHLKSADDSLWITILEDGGLEIEFADITEFYAQENTVTFYPADPSEKSADASRWEGTFREINDPVSDYEYYYTIRNLFGSNDYVLESRVTEYGDVRDQVMLFVYECQGDMLVHRYAPGAIYPVPTYSCCLVDGDRMYTSEGSTVEEDFPAVLQMLRDGQGIAYERVPDFRD